RLEPAHVEAGDVHAVDHVDVLEAGGAADGDVARRIDERAGRLLDHVAVGLAVRQVADVVAVEGGAHARAPHVDGGRLAGDDVHLLRGGAHGGGDLGVHAHRLLGGDDHA